MAETLSKMGTDHLPRLPAHCEAMHGGRWHDVSGSQPLRKKDQEKTEDILLEKITGLKPRIDIFRMNSLARGRHYV